MHFNTGVNPRTKVRVTAKNEKEWQSGGHYDGQDVSGFTRPLIT